MAIRHNSMVIILPWVSLDWKGRTRHTKTRKTVLRTRWRSIRQKGWEVRAELKRANPKSLVTSKGRKYLECLLALLQRQQQSKGRKDYSSPISSQDYSVPCLSLVKPLLLVPLALSAIAEEVRWKVVVLLNSLVSYLFISFTLLKLMIILESFCYVSPDCSFSTVCLVAAFELISSSLPSNLLMPVIYHREAMKKATPMSKNRAKVTLTASILLERVQLMIAVKEAKESCRRKSTWNVRRKYLTILVAFKSFSAYICKEKKVRMRKATQRERRMMRIAPMLLTNSLDVPWMESIEQQGPRENPKKAAGYFSLAIIGEIHSVEQLVTQKRVKQRQGTIQNVETEWRANFLGTITRLRRTNSMVRKKMTEEVASQQLQVSYVMQLAGGKAVTARLLEKVTLSSLGPLGEASCSLLDLEQVSESFWFWMSVEQEMSILTYARLDWSWAMISQLQSVGLRRAKAMAKLLLLSCKGREILRVILMVFFLANLTTLWRERETSLVNLQEEVWLITSHFHPSSMMQLAEHPSPFKLFPSSHWQYINSPSPQIQLHSPQLSSAYPVTWLHSLHFFPLSRQEFSQRKAQLMLQLMLWGWRVLQETHPLKVSRYLPQEQVRLTHMYWELRN